MKKSPSMIPVEFTSSFKVERSTPDELINLSGEVIAFTNNTSPVRLPLSAPYAFEHALAYPLTRTM